MAQTKLDVAFELSEFAAQMVKARFRRDNPGAADHEVEAHLGKWWQQRPGAEFGDVAGPIRVRNSEPAK